MNIKSIKEGDMKQSHKELLLEIIQAAGIFAMAFIAWAFAAAMTAPKP